jgi:hypothetical protein
MGDCGVPTKKDREIIKKLSEIIPELKGLSTLHKGGQPRGRSGSRARRRGLSPSRRRAAQKEKEGEDEDGDGGDVDDEDGDGGEAAAAEAPAARVEPVEGITKLHHAVTAIISAGLAGVSYVAIKTILWPKLIASGIVPQPCNGILDRVIDLLKVPLSTVGYMTCAERDNMLNQNMLAIAAVIGLTGGVGKTLQRATNAGMNSYNKILNWVHDNMGKCARRGGGSRRVAKARRSKTAKRRN